MTITAMMNLTEVAPDEVTAVVAYVISLQGTTPAAPKPPEGIADSAAAAPPSGS